MGLPSDEREFLRHNFGAAFSFAPPKGIEPTIGIVDFMQYVKVMKPDILTRDGMIEHFVNKIKWLLLRKGSSFRTIIVLVDGKPVPVKRMVEHAKRYKNKDVFSAKQGPYMPKQGYGLIPTEWIRFAGNYKLLRRELYPLLYNAFFSRKYFTPLPGQSIILSGFPGRSQWIHTGTRSWDAPERPGDGKVLAVTMWGDDELPITKKMELEDPDLYHRVYMLENIAPCEGYPKGEIRIKEWEEAKNSISEADTRMFYFDHWFQNENICYYLNDGDVFSIGLLYSYERLVGINKEGKYEFRNSHTACLPYKKKEGNEFFGGGGELPREEYVDINRLYELVREYPPMMQCGVQNAAATMAFLLIMAGSDFFQDYMKSIGTPTIWKVFFANVDVLTHMVQISEGVTPATRTKRKVVLDDDLFIQFCRWCFLEKYEKAELKRLKTGKLTYKQLKQRTRNDANGKPRQDTDLYLPDRNGMRVWARQVEWNLEYWKNAPLGYEPDAFETWLGVPYYPYMRDEAGKPTMVNVVASKQKPLDYVYEQHLYRYKVKHKKRMREEDVAHLQQAVIDKYASRSDA